MALRRYRRIRWSIPLQLVQSISCCSFCFDCFKSEIRFRNQSLVQSNPIVRIPRAGIGKDHLIPRLEPVYDLNGVHGALAQLDRSTNGFRSAAYNFEHADGVVLLPERRTADENYVIEVLELDCSINAEIGPRALRQRLIKRDLHIDRPLLYGGINARDVAIRDTVASVDHSFLTNLNVLRLSLSDLDLRFQLRRVRDAREVIADFQALSDLHRQLLQDSRHAGAYMQRFHLVSLQPGKFFGLVDRGLLRRYS